MAAGADSIDDMGLLRHGAMSTLFGGVRAPSTLGSHLRCYTWGNVAQLEKAGREFLVEPGRAGAAAAGADVLAFIDIDSMQKRVYGTTSKARGSGTRRSRGNRCWSGGLNALAAVVSTPLSAPVIAATRLRGGKPPPRAARRAWPPAPSAPPGTAAAPGRSWSGWTRRFTTPR
jgi:hypothetical protein